MSSENQSKWLYFQEGSSDKVYYADLVFSDGPTPDETGWLVRFAFGRRGTAFQSGTKTEKPIRYPTALAIYQKLISEKERKGYTEGYPIAGTLPVTFGKFVTVNTPVKKESSWDEYLKEKAGKAEPQVVEVESVSTEVCISPMQLNPITEDEAKDNLLNSDWVMQEKRDGRRLIVEVSGKEITGYNNSGKKIALCDSVHNAIDSYLRGKKSSGDAGSDFILDGESIGDTFHVFDCIKSGSFVGKTTKFMQRFNHGCGIVERIDSPSILIIPVHEKAGSNQVSQFKKFKDAGCEGVVFKRKDGLYNGGRPASGGPALKCKFYQTATCRVSKLNGTKRSVFLSLVTDGKGKSDLAEVQVGKVTIPANYEIPGVGQLCEIRYLYAYKGGALCQPVYQGVREDRLLPDRVETLKFKSENSDPEDGAE